MAVAVAKILQICQYWCYYLHMLRDSVCSVCWIFGITFSDSVLTWWAPQRALGVRCVSDPAIRMLIFLPVLWKVVCPSSLIFQGLQFTIFPRDNPHWIMNIPSSHQNTHHTRVVTIFLMCSVHLWTEKVDWGSFSIGHGHDQFIIVKIYFLPV